MDSVLSLYSNLRSHVLVETLPSHVVSGPGAPLSAAAGSLPGFSLNSLICNLHTTVATDIF